MNTFYNIDSVENVVAATVHMILHTYLYIHTVYIVRFEIEFKKVH